MSLSLRAAYRVEFISSLIEEGYLTPLEAREILMEKVEVKYMLPKETLELKDGLVKFVAAVKKSLDDGFQPGQDLPAMLTSAMTDLVPAVYGVQKLPEEAVADI